MSVTLAATPRKFLSVSPAPGNRINSNFARELLMQVCESRMVIGWYISNFERPF